MSWHIGRKVGRLILENKFAEIKTILDPFPPEQRRCIVSIMIDCSSLLFFAVDNDNVSIVKYFLEECAADPNSSGWLESKHMTCLSLAVISNYEMIVDIFLAYGADIEIAFSDQETALFKACEYNLIKMAKVLIAHGADVNSYNSTGTSCLMGSSRNFELYKYLISKGADVNYFSSWGITILTNAFDTLRGEMINFLLNCENIDVRLRNDNEEDALHLAIRYCTDSIVQKVITKGYYRKSEVIEAYELESCYFYLLGNEQLSRRLWKKALKLRPQPCNTLMFETRSPAGKFQKVKDTLNAKDVTALLYMESAYGFSIRFTLRSYVQAIKNINCLDKAVFLCDFLFDSLHSLDEQHFFQSYSLPHVIVVHYFSNDRQCNTSQLLHLFDTYAAFVLEFGTRYKRMDLTRRKAGIHKVQNLLHDTIELICRIDKKFPDEMLLFYDSIKRIVKANLRALRRRSITQLSIRMCSPVRVVKCLLSCGADMYSRDEDGRTLLHDVVEYVQLDRREMIEFIINEGIDFHRVQSNEYCIPCSIEKEGLLPIPEKHLSLQCLAIRTLCKSETSFSGNVPYRLQNLINLHLSF